MLRQQLVIVCDFFEELLRVEEDSIDTGELARSDDNKSQNVAVQLSFVFFVGSFDAMVGFFVLDVFDGGVGVNSGGVFLD